MVLNKKQAYIVCVTLLLIGLAEFYFFVPSFSRQVNTAAGFLSRADIKGLREYLLSFGIWAPMVSMGLMVLQALASPLPAFVITFANAWVFGWVLGAVYSWTGAMLGAALCFGIAKVYGRPVVEKLVGKKSLSASDRFFKKYGRYSVLIARLIPVVPFDIVSYAAGLTNMGFVEFLLATGVGQLPATVVYSWLGENITPTAKYAFWALCGFLALLIFGLGVQKKIKGSLAGDGSVE